MATEYLSSIFSLSGRTAIITGATGGLGSALATALAKAGVSTVVSIEVPDDRLSGELQSKIEGVGSHLKKFECDLADPKSLRKCYASVWESGIVPDILINCAGVMRRNLCENATDEELDLVSESGSLWKSGHSSPFIAVGCECEGGIRLLARVRTQVAVARPARQNHQHRFSDIVASWLQHECLLQYQRCSNADDKSFQQ